jgi:hypothetical protein
MHVWIIHEDDQIRRDAVRVPDPSTGLVSYRSVARVSPAGAQEPLFSWINKHWATRPMVKSRTLDRINSILSAWGWGMSFSQLFRIGCASFYLAKKVEPEIVRLAGRWRSLAYEAFCAFEQVMSSHMGGLMAQSCPAMSSQDVG